MSKSPARKKTIRVRYAHLEEEPYMQCMMIWRSDDVIIAKNPDGDPAAFVRKGDSWHDVLCMPKYRAVSKIK